MYVCVLDCVCVDLTICYGLCTCKFVFGSLHVGLSVCFVYVLQGVHL